MRFHCLSGRCWTPLRGLPLRTHSCAKGHETWLHCRAPVRGILSGCKATPALAASSPNSAQRRAPSLGPPNAAADSIAAVPTRPLATPSGEARRYPNCPKLGATNYSNANTLHPIIRWTLLRSTGFPSAFVGAVRRGARKAELVEVHLFDGRPLVICARHRITPTLGKPRNDGSTSAGQGGEQMCNLQAGSPAAATRSFTFRSGLPGMAHGKVDVGRWSRHTYDIPRAEGGHLYAPRVQTC